MISQNIPLAVGLQVIGSFCFALAAKYQHGTIDHEIQGNPEKKALSLQDFLKSIRQPKWIFGLILLTMSLLCQVIALIFAPVSIVQPVGLLAFPWSVLIQNRVEQTRLRKSLVFWVIAAVFATGIFTLVVSTYSTSTQEIELAKIIIGALVVYILSGIFGGLGWRGKKNLRALFWGSGGAMLYGLEAALVKTLVEYSHLENIFTFPAFWIILGALVIGSLLAGWMIQQGYATGKADVVVAAMTITSPVVAVIYGIAVLGEGNKIPMPDGFLIIFCAIVALGAVVEITRLRNTQNKLHR